MSDAQKIRDDTENAARRIAEAIQNPGPVPAYHAEIMARHRREWPTLWQAIDELLSAIPEQQ
jgi:hypothetical protein